MNAVKGKKLKPKRSVYEDLRDDIEPPDTAPGGRDDASEKDTASKGRRYESIAIINVAAGLDGCDDQLLPSSFRALEVDLNFHPSMLGQIALVQTLCLSIASPFWGYLSDHYSRKWILAAGSFAWGLVTIVLGLVSQFWHVFLLRALNGISLGSVGPISQSMLADTASQFSRGLAFGIVQLSTCMGRLIGGVLTTTFAFATVGNFLAWRICFLCVGVASILLSIVIAVFVREIPRNVHLKESYNGKLDTTGSTTGFSSFMEFLGKACDQSLRVPSVLIVLIEGLLGTVPWSALTFNTMYFQYCGMTDLQAALTTGGLLVGAGIGGVLGGILGDRLFLWSRVHGRPIIGQLAVLGRVPLVILTYQVLPKSQEYFYTYLAITFLVGLSSIAGIAVNRPVLADVVRPDHRGTVFSIIVAMEGSFSALLGAPLVGFLAENAFGYRRTTLNVHDMDPGLRLGNAKALASALFYQTTIPWALSFFLYGFLHLTYGTDQARLKKVLLEEFEEDVSESQEQLIVESSEKPSQ